MVAKAYLLFALVSAIALVDQAQGHPQKCHVASWGTTNGNVVKLETVYLANSIQHWKIFLPIELLQCVGVVLTVCDDDVAPEVRFATHFNVLVDRLSDLQGIGEVRGFAYCKYSRAMGRIGGSASLKPEVQSVIEV